MALANKFLLIFLVLIVNSNVLCFSQNSIIYVRKEFRYENTLKLNTELVFDKTNSIYYVRSDEENSNNINKAKLVNGEKFQLLDSIYRSSSNNQNVLALRHTISGNRFCVIENNIVTKWNLVTTEKEILGFKCKLAKTNFNGVTYSLWYAEELNFPYGPNKIGGLPGIILEVYDDKKEIVHILADKINLDDLNFTSKVNLKTCTQSISISQYNDILQKEIQDNNNKAYDIMNKTSENN